MRKPISEYIFLFMIALVFTGTITGMILLANSRHVYAQGKDPQPRMTRWPVVN